MKLIYLLPIIIGMVGILQGALNKEMALKIGVGQTVLVGMTLTFVFGVLFYLAVKFFPGLFNPIYHLKAPLTTWRWWFIIPGILGLVIVGLFPEAIYELGAVKTTILIVAAQVIFSLFWDSMIEKLPITPFKWLGMVFAFISVVLMGLK
jgi:transporter family-2 protein